MVLMNLFTGQEQRLKCREWTCGHSVGQTESSTDICTLLRVAHGASLVAQLVKNPPAMPETRVRSLGWEDPLEKGMATHSSNLAWRIPWTEVSGRLQSMQSQRVEHN